MSPVKQVQLVVLLVVAAALLAGARTAQGQVYEVSGNTRLQPSPFGDEPDASGSAYFEGDVWLGPSWGSSMYQGAYFDGTLTVNCRGLTPFATYQINESTSFTADSNGAAKLKLSPFSAVGGGYLLRRMYVSFQVTIERQVTDSNPPTYVDVLQGSISVRVW
jgi:hypothetical protein